jgi:hypothetical protein
MHERDDGFDVARIEGRIRAPQEGFHIRGHLRFEHDKVPFWVAESEAQPANDCSVTVARITLASLV